MRIRKALVLPDDHTPHHDPWSLDAICEYAASQWWDWLIHLGDHLDLPFISRFNIGMPGNTQGQTLEHDIKVGGEVLDCYLQACRAKNPRCKAAYVQGNHEFRRNDFVAKHPWLAGTLDIPKLLDLKKRRVEWVPFWSEGAAYTIGDATFIHGDYINMHHAKKHATSYGGKVYYGHTHTIQEYSEALKGGGVVLAKSMGCLCQKPDWMRGKPDRWQQAFGVFHFLPDGTHRELTVKIVDRKFISPEGDLYSA